MVFLFTILCIGFDQEKWVSVLRQTEVCRLPKSVRSLVTHDTKLWKGMCTAPDANRSVSSSTILLSHCIPAKEKERWSSEVKRAAGNLCRSRTRAHQQLAGLRWAQRGSSCQTSPRRTGKKRTGKWQYVRIRKENCHFYFTCCCLLSYLQVAQSGQQGFCLFAAQTGASFSLSAEVRNPDKTEEKSMHPYLIQINVT